MIGTVIVLWILAIYTAVLGVELKSLEEDYQELKKLLLEKKVIDKGENE